MQSRGGSLLFSSLTTVGTVSAAFFFLVQILLLTQLLDRQRKGSHPRLRYVPIYVQCSKHKSCSVEAYKWTIEALLEKHPRHDKGKLRSCWSRVTGVPLTAFRFLPATGFGCYNLRTELTKFVGWAGYTLARSLDPKKYQAVVVSPRSYFVFTPLLASTSTGTLEFRTALEPIRSRRTAVNFFQGWADSVDFKNKTVTIEEGVDDPNQGLALAADRHASESKEERRAEKVEEAKKGQLFDLTYDKLIISVGCYSHTFGTPGVKENALFLKDVGDARKIRNRLLACRFNGVSS